VEHQTAQVLIVGGGPAGLSAAILLAERGIDVLLVERHPATSRLPRAHLLNQRTMEIFTEIGVATDVYALSPPEDRWHRVAWHTTLAGTDGLRGRVLGFLPAWGGGPDTTRYAAASPCRYANVPQLRLDPVLRARAEAVCAPQRVRFYHELTALDTDRGTVRATVLDRANGEPYTVEARYLVAADGGRSCAGMLGVTMEGPTDLLDMVTVHASADLSPWIDDDEVLLRFFINPDGQGSFAGAMCAMGPTGWGRDSTEWAIHTAFRTGDPTRFDTGAVLTRVRRFLGIPDLDLDVHAISHWEFEGVVAQRFRHGPAFLAGNAAHRHPPTGGLGLNTAIQDVHNLAWKLDAVLSGRAGEALLDTYDTERRPVGAFTVQHCLSNAGGHARVAAALGLRAGQPEGEGWAAVAAWAADSPAGAATRAAVAEAIASNADDYSQLGVELGYRYAAGALVPDGSPPPTGGHPLRDYLPTIRPGHHLPHAWLHRDGREVSTHDLVARTGLTLLTGDADVPQWTDAARRVHGVTVHIRSIGTEPAGAILVRPDRHVAWRVPDWTPERPAQLEAAVRRILGLDPPTPGEEPT
jgi:2,4-dichlorophenol 6-monooxygenase